MPICDQCIEKETEQKVRQYLSQRKIIDDYFLSLKIRRM